MGKTGFHIEAIRATFKRKFIAGLFVSIPAIITILVIEWLFRFVDGLLSPAIDTIVGKHIPGLGFVATVVMIFLLGMISTNVVGRKVLDWLEKGILRIPLFRSIYSPTKQLMDAFSSNSRAAFKSFVIVEYPRPGLYAFGFLTNESVLKTSEGGCENVLNAVYVPTNHLYLGDIVLTKKEDIINTNIPIEEGVRIILSGGIATPQTILTVKDPTWEVKKG
jgi:uncharacterized membrane protein